MSNDLELLDHVLHANKNAEDMQKPPLDPAAQVEKNTEALQKYLNANSGRSEVPDPIKVAALWFDDIPIFLVGYFGSGCHGGFVRGMNAAFDYLAGPDKHLQFKVVARECATSAFGKNAPKFLLHVTGPVGSARLSKRLKNLGFAPS